MLTSKDGNFKLEQIKTIHQILKYLLDKESLSNDPLTVEFKRKGYPSVFPCRRGGEKLDIGQVEWALKENKWWFIGSINHLKISKIKKEKLSQDDIKLLKRIAKDIDFNLSLSFHKNLKDSS